jgi:hypothetical protein
VFQHLGQAKAERRPLRETVLQGSKAVAGMIRLGKKAEKLGHGASQRWKLEERFVRGNSYEVESEHGGACQKRQAVGRRNRRDPRHDLGDIVEQQAQSWYE